MKLNFNKFCEKKAEGVMEEEYGPDFNEWCEKRAEEIMEEEYGPDWMDTCGDDDAYSGALEQAGYEYPFEDYEDEENDDID